MVTRSFLLFAINVTLNLSYSATQSPVKMLSRFTLWLSNVRTGSLPSSLFWRRLPSAHDCQINTDHSVPEISPRTNGSLKTGSQSFSESIGCFGPEKWGLYHFLVPAKLKAKRYVYAWTITITPNQAAEGMPIKYRPLSNESGQVFDRKGKKERGKEKKDIRKGEIKGSCEPTRESRSE